MFNSNLSSRELIAILNKQTSANFHMLNDEHMRKIQPIPNTHAAVLILIIDTKEELKILLTKRSVYLPHHAGQISFPGGKFAANDKNLLETALRETYEETGLSISTDNVIGYLSEYVTVSRFFKVIPFIAVCDEVILSNLKPNNNEVAEIIIVPLLYFLKNTHYRQAELIRNGKRISYKEINYLNHEVWGVTANILHDFSNLINENC